MRVAGKGKKANWLLPLVCHCTIHGAFTIVVALLIRPEYYWLTMVDFAINFVMDRIKAAPDLLGRYKQLAASEFRSATVKQIQENNYFWWSLGLDQMVHSLTNLLIVFLLLT